MAQADPPTGVDFSRKHRLLRDGVSGFHGGVCIRVRLLGTAAGGGLPQWNCSCANCRQARKGAIPSRTQSSVAVSADGHKWFLINASPDLRAQIEAFPDLHPAADPPRNSPISAVLLTNADLDHVLGLYLLRERNSLRVHAPEPIFQVLAEDLRLVDILKPFCRVEWRVTPGPSLEPLFTAEDEPSGLRYRALPLSTKPPPFSSTRDSNGAQSVAYEIIDERTRGRLVIAPDVAALTPELLFAMNEADAVLFDGTFWSENEFRNVTGKARTADEMGHLIIRDGSLPVLEKLKARHKIYLHINNTNPILDPNSAERVEVARAGLTVGYDGLEFEL